MTDLLYCFFIILSFVLAYGWIYLIGNREEKVKVSKLMPITFVSSIFTAIIYTVVVNLFQGRIAIGMSSLGGAVGYVCSLLVYNKFKSIYNFETIFRRFVSALPLIYGISKISCYIKGCCGSVNTEVPIQIIEAIIFIWLFFICVNRKTETILYVCCFVKFALEGLRYNTETINANQIFCLILLVTTVIFSILNKYKQQGRCLKCKKSKL